jgi:tetratricopeptide (TPR) repeat protein
MTLEQAIALQERAWALQSEGQLEDARDACQDALLILEKCEGSDSLDVANVLNDLAEIEKENQNFPHALAAAERALSIEKEHGHGGGDENVQRIFCKTLTLLGEIQRALGKYAHAEENLRNAVALAKCEFGAHSEEYAHALNHLAVLCKHCGRFDEGLGLYREALRLVADIHGDRSLEASVIYHNIGGILFSRGDFASAEAPGRKAWEISRAFLGENAVRAVADAVAYAAILDVLGRQAESEAIYRHALAVYESELGADHYEVAATLHNLGALLFSRGQFSESERCYRRALAVKEKLLGSDNPDVALTLTNLGSVLISTSRASQAVPLLTHAWDILRRELLPGHPQLAVAEETLERATGAQQKGT